MDGIGATSQLMLGATSQLTKGDVFSIAGTVCLAPHSWDVGPAHIISFSTEVYFFLWYGLELVPQRYHWLGGPQGEEVLLLFYLMTCNLWACFHLACYQPRAASKAPWIITMAYHPMYCTTTNGDENLVRVV